MRAPTHALFVLASLMFASTTYAAPVKGRWVLVPGVNCSVSDFRAIFGGQNVLTLGDRFDDAWKESLGQTTVSADTDGALASSGRSYNFAASNGRAAVVKHYTAPNQEPLEVGLSIQYNTLVDTVSTSPSSDGCGGAYASNILWLRVTDTDTGKSQMKWVLNHGHCSCSVIFGETYRKDEEPLTFTLVPGHHYKLEAIIETMAAGYNDPGSDAGQAQAALSVRVAALKIVPKNPPWVSIWCTLFVPRTFDTYDRYERALLASTGQHYFPAEFRIGVSAGGDYAPSDSFIRLSCPDAQVVSVQGDLQSVAQISPGRAYFPLPAGGGIWRAQLMLDCEVDPLKVPVMPLPAPLVQYFLATDGIKIEPHTLAQYDPDNWAVLIGGQPVPFSQWGTGAIAHAIIRQHMGSVPEFNWDTLCIVNPRSGQPVSLTKLSPAPESIPHLRLQSGSAPSPEQLQAVVVNRRVLYSQTRTLQFTACAANGTLAKDEKSADTKYEAVFDFIPRPMDQPLQAQVGLGEL